MNSKYTKPDLQLQSLIFKSVVLKTKYEYVTTQDAVLKFVREEFKEAELTGDIPPTLYLTVKPDDKIAISESCIKTLEELENCYAYIILRNNMDGVTWRVITIKSRDRMHNFIRKLSESQGRPLPILNVTIPDMRTFRTVEIEQLLSEFTINPPVKGIENNEYIIVREFMDGLICEMYEYCSKSILTLATNGMVVGFKSFDCLVDVVWEVIH